MRKSNFLEQIKRWPNTSQNDVEVDRIASELSGGERRLEGLLRGALSNSAYLRRLIEKYPEQIDSMVLGGASGSMDDLVASLPIAAGSSKKDFARQIRRTKEKYHLCLALTDLGGVWSTEKVIHEFSNFADKIIQRCLEFSWNRMAAKGGTDLSSDALTDLVQSSGLFVVAFGKLGGRELNYSSDVDLAFFWQRSDTADKFMQIDERQIIFIAREIVSLLSEVSEFGYVFRVDLRLRPDPSSTPIVLSTNAALTYYESVGQTWERSAWIKARVVAGDHEAGAMFFEQMRSFIWRKNLDFATIDDVHQIRQQIFFGPNQPKSPHAGYNVKLGVGGIREIELFAQTLQLIHGGRVAGLQLRNTIAALQAMISHNLISKSVAQELTKDYFFLRRVEHALQMRNDFQTHEIPESNDSQQQFQNLLGYSSPDRFHHDLQDCTKRVAYQTQSLFGENNSSNTSDMLHLFSLEDHPEAISLLEKSGFKEPSAVLERMRGWVMGRIRATQSQRSQRLLAKLSPELIQAFGKSENPDAAFLSFSQFIEALPAGVQILSLFANSPGLLVRLIDIFQLAPKLGVVITVRPALIETLLVQDPFDEFCGSDALNSLRLEIANAKSMELAMDVARRKVQEAHFVIGSHLLTAVAEPAEIAERCSGLAESTIAALALRVARNLETTAGRCPVHWAVLGMGKLGSREMSPASDVDLMVVYRDNQSSSENIKTLPPEVWAARFTRRLISALSVPTSEGLLYEVDMNLRPSGRSGPISVEFSAFWDYYKRDARVWEFQALCRARVVSASSKEFGHALDETIKRIVNQLVDRKQVRSSIVEMRNKLALEKPALGLWDLKRGNGGLMELEFSLQALALLSCKPILQISLFKLNNTIASLMVDDKIEPLQFDQLKSAHQLFHRVQQITSLAVGRIGTMADLPPRLLAVLLTSCKMSSLQQLEHEISLCRSHVASILSHILSVNSDGK